MRTLDDAHLTGLSGGVRTFDDAHHEVKEVAALLHERTARVTVEACAPD